MKKSLVKYKPSKKEERSLTEQFSTPEQPVKSTKWSNRTLLNAQTAWEKYRRVE